MAGARGGHLRHTMNGAVAALRINGRRVGEIGVWAILAGIFVFSILFDRSFEPRVDVLLWGLPTALVTAVLSPVLFLPFAGVDRLVRGRRAADSLLR